jgi:hypothetical protein
VNPTPKPKYWAQTPEGRIRMSKIQKKLKREKRKAAKAALQGTV